MSVVQMTSMGALAAVLLTLSPQPGEACPAPWLGQPLSVPSDGATVPSDLPGISIKAEDTFPPCTESAVLQTDAGTAPTLTAHPKSGSFIDFTFDSALQPDTTYRLQFATNCQASATVQFTTAATATLPSSAGTLNLAPATVSTPGPGPCLPDTPIATSYATFTPSDQVRPFLAAARVDVNVDGSQYSESRFDVSVQPLTLPSLEAACDPDVQSSLLLAPGKHSATVSVLIPGMPALTTAPVEVDLDCAGQPHHATCGSTVGVSLAALGAWSVLTMTARRRRVRAVSRSSRR